MIAWFKRKPSVVATPVAPLPVVQQVVSLRQIPASAFQQTVKDLPSVPTPSETVTRDITLAELGRVRLTFVWQAAAASPYWKFVGAVRAAPLPSPAMSDQPGAPDAFNRRAEFPDHVLRRVAASAGPASAGPASAGQPASAGPVAPSRPPRTPAAPHPDGDFEDSAFGPITVS